MAVSLLYTSCTAVRVFYLYRHAGQADPLPNWRLRLAALPWLVLMTAGSSVLWTYLTSLLYGYTAVVVVLVVTVNFLTLRLAGRLAGRSEHKVEGGGGSSLLNYRVYYTYTIFLDYSKFLPSFSLSFNFSSTFNFFLYFSLYFTTFGGYLLIFSAYTCWRTVINIISLAEGGYFL